MKDEIINYLQSYFRDRTMEQCEMDYVRITELWDHLCFDEENIINDIEHDYLTLYDGLGRCAGLDNYHPDDEWWWYLDESRNAAINVRTGCIIEGKDIDVDFE